MLAFEESSLDSSEACRKRRESGSDGNLFWVFIRFCRFLSCFFFLFGWLKNWRGIRASRREMEGASGRKRDYRLV
jgi:hypothetical protein